MGKAFRAMFQTCQNGMINNVTVEGNKLNEASNYHSIYSDYQPLPGSSVISMTTPVMTPASTPSYQQLNQMSPHQAVSSGSQFDHITVMTNLQQQPSDLYTGNPAASVSNGIAYTVPNSTNTSALQIYPPSAITQQVQQSVPALNAMPPTVMQSRSDYSNSMQRLQPARASNSRTKTDDGPTVRQHLQQQHRARLQQQLAMQEKAKMDKDDLITDYSGMISSAVDKMLPVSTTVNLPPTSDPSNMLVSAPMNIPTAPSINVPASPSINALTSPSMNIPVSPSTNVPASPSMNMPQSSSMNVSRVSQMPRQQYIPRMATPQQPRMVTDRPPRNATFPRSPAATAIAETSMEIAQKKSPTRKRNHSMMSASQVRVTVLGTQSEPATQQIITESDHVLPIHGIAGPPKQARIELADRGPGKDVPRSGEERAPWQFARTASNATTSVGTSQTMESCSKNNDIGIDASNAQKSFALQIGNNSYSLPNTEPLLTEPMGSSTNGSEMPMMSGPSNMATAPPMLTGNGTHLSESIREVMAQVDDDVLNYTREAQYVRKLYFMKRLVESLVIKNGALCDEVSRLNQRIRTVMEERRVLAKRLQHHERNRIRRIQTKLKKQAAARAAKTNESQLIPTTTAGGTEGGLPAGDMETYESDDSDKTIVSSCAASPNTSTSQNSDFKMSRVETPEPASRNQEFMSKMMLVNPVAQEGGKFKMKSSMRRQLSTKRTLSDRKEKKVSSN
uniref:JmjC domain-containing protein n=1 Tax=Elaeophora elaphi TaxID=1147741 RepID=A0A0R3S1R2_9BILA